MGLCRCPEVVPCGVHDPAFRDAHDAYVAVASSSDSATGDLDADALDHAAQAYSTDYGHDKHSDTCWPDY